ncbi:MAG TPA: sxtJ [Methylococcaceae bacterium]|jgi:hypothetical protein|nr:sxtJ [Methylococcaceae bacterium]HIN68910.1 sxtJ [Methylococcales bacterium]HIA44321.1 sxtJ [Methylococcaceae bacterium]HIB62869.1 sxtJ [Methylococcaceae bacterium]HIO13132.1 sxtJ [Methylococcales bacterium]
MKMITNKAHQKTELRNFGLLTATLFVIIFGIGLPLLFEPESSAGVDLWIRAQLVSFPVSQWVELYDLPLWPWFLAVFLGFWALVWPIVLYPFFRFWMALGNVLGWINTRIILGILFYFLFMPLGLVMRLFGYDPMLRKLNRQQSYRQQSTVLEKNHMERPY